MPGPIHLIEEAGAAPSAPVPSATRFTPAPEHPGGARIWGRCPLEPRPAHPLTAVVLHPAR